MVLTRGFHQALTEFQWLAEYLVILQTLLDDTMLLQPMLDGYHDAYGYMCEWLVLPGPTAVPRTPEQQPITAATYLETVGLQPIV